MKPFITLAAFSLLFLMRGPAVTAGPYQYPFQNPDLPIEQRVDNIVSLMTLDEKVACLGTRPNVPRLGIQGTGHVEGLHGLALGGPGRMGTAHADPHHPIRAGHRHGRDLGSRPDPQSRRRGRQRDALHLSEQDSRGGLVVRAPNADLGRDPRWGRTEECFGEDPFFNSSRH